MSLVTAVEDGVLQALEKAANSAFHGQPWDAVLKALGDDAYQVVARALLGKDFTTTAQALLKALSDGQLTDAELRGVLLAGVQDLARDNETVKALASRLEDGQLTPEELVSVVAGWASRRVKDAKLSGLLNQLSTGGLGKDQILALLLKAGDDLAGDSQLAHDLVKALGDGKLTTPELVDVLTAYAKRRLNHPLAGALVDALASPPQNPQQAWDDVRKALAAVGLDPAILAGVDALLAADLTPEGLLRALGAWAATVDDETLAAIVDRLHLAEPVKVLVAWLGSTDVSHVAALLKELGAGNWQGILAVALGCLDVSLGGDALKALQAGGYYDALLAELTGLLQRLGVSHQADVAKAILELLTGARTLFATAPESDAPDLNTPWRVGLFRGVRLAIYQTLIFIDGGAIVSTSPTGDLHIFQAAEIRFDTPLHKVLPKSDDLHRRELFCNVLTGMLDLRFVRDPYRMHSRFSDDGVLVLPEEQLDAKSPVAAKAAAVYDKVRDRIRR